MEILVGGDISQVDLNATLGSPIDYILRDRRGHGTFQSGNENLTVIDEVDDETQAHEIIAEQQDHREAPSNSVQRRAVEGEWVEATEDLFLAVLRVALIVVGLFMATIFFLSWSSRLGAGCIVSDCWQDWSCLCVLPLKHLLKSCLTAVYKKQSSIKSG